MTLPLSVCWGLRFPWESRLTVSHIHKKTVTHTEYIVVHDRDLSILLTMWQVAGHFDSNFLALSTPLEPSLTLTKS